ncbi:glutathione S-transferase [Morchella snyderi]|nr:glutathione S-transferase [Morchella snyderi]
MGHPDSDVHPVDTGAAKTVVDCHQEDQVLILYGSWSCPFVQRVWLVLEEKKVPPYKWVEVNPYNKPGSLMKINPRGLLPTLEHDGKSLYESSVICEFIEDSYPDYKKLLPVDAYDRAYSRLWSDFVSTRIVPVFYRYLQFLPATDLPGLEGKRQEFLDTLLTFSEAMRELKEGGFFSGGSSPIMVDLIAAPWLQSFWVLDEYKGPFFKRWNAWIKSLSDLKSYNETESDREPTRKLYKRYSDNTAQSEVAKAIRAGRGMP